MERVLKRVAESMLSSQFIIEDICVVCDAKDWKLAKVSASGNESEELDYLAGCECGVWYHNIILCSRTNSTNTFFCQPIML